MSNQRLPYIPQISVLGKLFSVIDEPKVIMILFTTLMLGLRISEVIKLKKCNMDFERKIATILDAKNRNRKKDGYGKDRIVPIPDMLISPLQKWFDITSDINTPWLFCGDKTPENHYNYRRLEGKFDYYRKKAGLTRVHLLRGKKQQPLYELRFHHLRHWYAQKIYDTTGDIYVTGECLGHANLETTRVYAKCSAKKKTEAVALAFSTPIDKVVQRIRTQRIQDQKQSPIEILQRRLATGEIDHVTYRRLLMELNAEILVEN